MTKNAFDFPEDDGTPRLADPQGSVTVASNEDAEAAGEKAGTRKRASGSMTSMRTCWAATSSRRRATSGRPLKSTTGCNPQIKEFVGQHMAGSQ